MGLVARHATALLGGVALGVLVAGAAGAQSTNPNTKFVTLLERLVIGAGADKVAIDTPQAVTVVTQEDIDAKQASTIGDILKETPGVAITGSQRALGEGFNIRGVGAAETSGDEARIIITVDGAKKFYEQYRMGSFFSDPELYKQVEVLRGPASSTLYGSGAFGGVINFTTKDASDFLADGQNGALRVKGSYNSNGNGVLASGILAQRINDTFEVLAAGNFRQSDLQRLANGDTLTGSEFEAWSGLLKGTIYLDGEQVVRVSHQRWDSDADNQYYAQTGTNDVFGRVDRHVVDQTSVLSYENPDSANDMLDLKVQLSYSDTAVTQDNATLVNQITDAEYAYKTLQLDVQNASTFGGDGWENIVTYGVQFANQERTAVPTDGSVITTHPEGTSTSVGVFAQTEHTINEQLTLIGGARVDLRHLDPSDELTVSTPSDDIAFSPKVAALYRFNENFNVFGSVAHTERMPTLDEMFQYTSTRPANLDLQKEYSNNVEAGFGLSGYNLVQPGDSAGVKVTGFVNDITDGIRSNPVSSGAPYFVNIAGMRIWGLEVEGSYESERLFARLAYTFTRGEYTETFIGSGSSNPATNAGNTRYAGDPLDSLPQDKVALTLGARLPEQSLEIGGTITVADTPISQITGAVGTSSSWATLDLFATWKPQEGPFKGLEAQFGIDNVFDTDYRENLSLDRSTGRTYKVTLAKQFDY